jgi:Tfp pilus assembly protein PilV
MKRIATFVLLIALSIAGTISVHAQRTTPEEDARQSRKAAKAQQKMLNKSNRRQRKAQKKAMKAQRKSVRKANRRNQY